jgi:hypothetical protein
VSDRYPGQTISGTGRPHQATSAEFIPRTGRHPHTYRVDRPGRPSRPIRPRSRREGWSASLGGSLQRRGTPPSPRSPARCHVIQRQRPQTLPGISTPAPARLRRAGSRWWPIAGQLPLRPNPYRRGELTWHDPKGSWHHPTARLDLADRVLGDWARWPTWPPPAPTQAARCRSRFGLSVSLSTGLARDSLRI